MMDAPSSASAGRLGEFLGLVGVLLLIAMVAPPSAHADFLECATGSAEVSVGSFIADGRTQLDVAVGESDAVEDVPVVVSDSAGTVLKTRTIDLSGLAISKGTADASGGAYKLFSITGLPSTGPLVVTIGDQDASMYVGCGVIEFQVPRKPGAYRFRWVQVSDGYALDASSVFGITNYTVTTDGSCQTLPVGVAGTVSVSGDGVAGSGSRTIRFADICELVPGHSHLRRSVTAGATITGIKGVRVAPTYTQAGKQTYSLRMRAGGKTISSRQTTTFAPSYKVWEGTDQYFNYCIRNLFDVDIVMQNGQRYCVHPSQRTL